MSVSDTIQTSVNCSCSNTFKTTTPALQTAGSMVFALVSVMGVAPKPLFAQSITTAPDGTGTIVDHDGNTYHIQGGTQAGRNLFHSFQDFGLNNGEIANFLSNPGVTNIFGRVTGGNPSIIDGLIQVSGANSNLYLMNPAGMVFGSNASLNVMGDFTATTATGIEFSDGVFHAYDRPTYAQLVSPPQGFIFSNATNGSIINQGDLTAQAGKEISLVGGTVVNTGTVKATDGQITLAAVPGTSRVKLSQPGMLLSLEIEKSPATSELQPLDLPELLTGAGIPESLQVNAGDVVTTGEITGQAVTLMATGRVKPSDPTLVRTHNGTHHAPTVVLLPDEPDGAIAYTAIDSRADNALDLLYGGKSGTISKLIIREEKGIEAIAHQLTDINVAGYEIEAVNIVAEGNAGNFWLGNEWITHKTVGNYQAEFEAIGNTLTAQADLLLYSCFMALGLPGETLMASIADLTGADVAASVNATGSANYGADWVLEQSTGEIEAANPFTDETIANWDGKLATLTVTNLLNTGAGSLRNQIAAAAAGDDIVFNVSGTINLGSEIAWATNNLTIDGSGQSVVVDGGGSGRLFNIGATNATINNLTLQNGSVGGSGGGIRHTGGGVLQLNTTTVSGNSSGSRGGGIYSQGFATVLNSTIANNSASDRGGGLVTFGNATVTNSTIDANSAGARGGGIRSLGNVIVSNSTITNNSTGTRGGGIYSDGIVGLTTSTVAGNSANIDGGGIVAINSDINILASTLAGNEAVTGNGGGLSITNGNVTLSNSTLSGNIANDFGGGLFLNAGDATITNSTIAFNVADSDTFGFGEGGGLHITGIGTHQIVNSIIANNSDLSMPGSNFADISADLSLSTMQNSLVQDITGISGTTLTNGVNGNIIGLDPQLAPLANNGGPTQTHALQTGSPALDAGDNAFATATDQRGQARIANGTIDLGALEVAITPPTMPTPTPPPTTPTPTLPPSTSFTSTQDVNNLKTSESVEFTPVVIGDRIDQLLASDQICGAVEAADRYHTQEFRQHFGQFALEDPLSCDEMQRQLPEDAMLVSVFANADQLHLVTLTTKGDPTHYTVPIPRETVLATITAFQQSLTNPILRKSDQFLAPSQQLYQWIVEPLEAQLRDRGTHNILFTLGDGLRTLPLAALHDGKQFLLENYQASLIPSLSLTPTHRPDLQDASVLAVGISEFDELTPLPAVPVEIASIKAQFPKTNSVQNKDATFTNFQNQLQNRSNQIVHLSTHGNFRPGQAASSYIQFWDNQLNLEDVQDLNWSQSAVELLVLSACQTALGDTSVEYGFAGLAVQAQAGAAVAGLWGANDTATLALMNEFYRQLRLGQPKGEALRQAQLALLQGTVRVENKQLVGQGKDIRLPSDLQRFGDRSFWHPYYWSAFTLIGNPW
ncbi:MAG: CHAT domain-containing protein [Spirulina sp. SIO3F2]|nr:CHAT domain-containing protein [Spirulina sp. SIO3F2]